MVPSHLVIVPQNRSTKQVALLNGYGISCYDANQQCVGFALQVSRPPPLVPRWFGVALLNTYNMSLWCRVDLERAGSLDAMMYDQLHGLKGYINEITGTYVHESILSALKMYYTNWLDSSLAFLRNRAINSIARIAAQFQTCVSFRPVPLSTPAWDAPCWFVVAFQSYRPRSVDHVLSFAQRTISILLVISSRRNPLNSISGSAKTTPCYTPLVANSPSLLFRWRPPLNISSREQICNAGFSIQLIVESACMCRYSSLTLPRPSILH